MPASLRPTPAQLRVGLHALILTLAIVVMLRAVALDAPRASAISLIVTTFVITYAVRLAVDDGRVRAVGLAVLIGLWVGLVLLDADAAYATVGLVLVVLTELPIGVAAALVVALTVFDVGADLWRGGSAAGLVAPIMGATLASLFGLGYRVLFDATAKQAELITELERTRGELAESEHAAGQAAERQRLAREIHDTVAQGLSSIQLLLRSIGDDEVSPDVARRIALAGQAAGSGLSEARRLVAELAPADLADASLAAALQRVCDRAVAPVRFRVDGEPVPLPMSLEAALVRITQGALANVDQHAGPGASAAVTLGWTSERVRLDIADDGVGFDVSLVDDSQEHSFGLHTILSRVHELGGEVEIESEPGHTAMAVSFPAPRSHDR